MGKAATTESDAEDLLRRIIDWYLSSRDFNGWPVRADDLPESAGPDLEALFKQGLLQVVGEKDFQNPHVRPWKPRRSDEEQLKDLHRAVTDADRGVCVYPTPKALQDRIDPALYRDSPYHRRMAEGSGTLELTFFDFEVLERYRNDPRYTFQYWDFGVNVGIGDEAYLDESEPDRDKTSMSHVGFAYWMPEDRDGPIVRRVCAFVGDLADLTPAHQRHWSSYELDASQVEGVDPHPVWWGAQINAQWADGPGPFTKLLAEMEAVNELTERALGERLFGTTDRPEAFGWVLRPTQKEWDDFIMILDKLLSENIRHDALDRMGAATEEDGNKLGSLARLERGLDKLTDVGQDHLRQRLESLREVRKARQKPAHALRQNVTDRSFVKKQRDLMKDVIISVQSLRILWQQHPENKTWAPKPYLEGKFYTL